MTDRQRHGLILLVVAGLIAVSAVLISTKPTRLGLDLKGGVELVYQGQRTPQSNVNSSSLARAVQVMRNRVDQLGVTEPQIQTEGKNLIDVQLPDVKDIAQAEATVGTTARLEFLDWEANALTPTGQRVAGQLLVNEPSAVAISQGSSAVAPGTDSTSAGAMGLYQAVQLASKQPYSPPSGSESRYGSEYFLFGAPGSSACAAYAHAQGTTVVKGVHCLIAGPVQVASNLPYKAAVGQLEQGLGTAETAGTQVLFVKQGTTVLEAVPNSFSPSRWPAFGSPSAGYYVLHDDVSLFGNEITNPQQSNDSAGDPNVTFGFTGKGAAAFQRVTYRIAQRGERVSLGGREMLQHFAIALDNQLISVPSIDYHQYQDGISGGGGAEITGGFTISTAQSLATQLRLGALPIRLVRISESQVSATLGSQALHQGLIAGIVGLAVVIVFLLAYYRLLGMIAVAGLFAYGIYFYALIKLIPVTMTLAGIAGLILTIGVAADANIVIFERVKEEIRAGRSIRQGIVTGYRKGLTAIIDANVVTIMTAFILFVLATADVKGFAFTLGIGTFVSLFTAVLATQAILMTLGDTRAIRSASLLGAGGGRRRWRFDFMGASRYFFSMSGAILLIGALAIGARGLNLGIDFTSGTQISVGLNHPASVAQVRSLMTSIGEGDATIQKVSAKGGPLGPYGYQIDSKYLGTFSSGPNRGQSKYDVLRSDLESRFGIRSNSSGSQDINTTSVGPTFGSAVTKSAVIAIVISLIMISIYITLRFDWKFAVPVLIALMHDVLITSGVYALTGRVVTTDTVAALLTILGYSLYDTIIVFDRVRENIPRMPRAAFSQIVNRSMSEVLTRSLATTSCTLMPIIALLLFGGSTLKDFAFALLIGVASGAYSSIFIASPVLTHWKEREHGFQTRRERILGELGWVPAYAEGADIEPTPARIRPTGRLTTPQADGVSAAEFEQMKRDLGLDEPAAPSSRRAAREQARAKARQRPAATAVEEPTVASRSEEPTLAAGESEEPGAEVTPAPDVAENEGVAQVKSGPSASKRPRNRRHGRRR